MNIQARVRKLENQTDARSDTADLINVIFICFVFPGEDLKPMTLEMKEQTRAEIIQKTREDPAGTRHLIFLPEGYEAPFDDIDCVRIVKFARDWTPDNN